MRVTSMALLDAGELAEDDDADLVFVEVQRQSERAVREADELVRHAPGQALDVRDAVGCVSDVSDLGLLRCTRLVRRGELRESRTDLVGADGSSAIVSSSPVGCAATGLSRRRTPGVVVRRQPGSRPRASEAAGDVAVEDVVADLDDRPPTTAGSRIVSNRSRPTVSGGQSLLETRELCVAERHGGRHHRQVESAPLCDDGSPRGAASRRCGARGWSHQAGTRSRWPATPWPRGAGRRAPPWPRTTRAWNSASSRPHRRRPRAGRNSLASVSTSSPRRRGQQPDPESSTPARKSTPLDQRLDAALRAAWPHRPRSGCRRHASTSARFCASSASLSVSAERSCDVPLIARTAAMIDRRDRQVGWPSAVSAAAVPVMASLVAHPWTPSSSGGGLGGLQVGEEPIDDRSGLLSSARRLSDDVGRQVDGQRADLGAQRHGGRTGARRRSAPVRVAVTRAASIVADSSASATISLPSSRAVSRMRAASVRASASWAVYSSRAASALRCASSAFAMLPSIASPRSSSASAPGAARTSRRRSG